MRRLLMLVLAIAFPLHLAAAGPVLEQRKDIMVERFRIAISALAVERCRLVFQRLRLLLGRAEALRRAKMAMLDPARPAEFAHPLAWAPFVVVGEGGASR